MTKNIIIGIVVTLNIGLVYLVKQQSKANQIQQAFLSQQVQQKTNKKEVNDLIANKYWWELNSQGQRLSSLQVTGDLLEDQSPHSLADLIGQDHKLVMRYSELHCDVCVDETMKQLKRFTEEIGQDQVLLISSYANPRDMYTFKRLNQIQLPLYNLGEQKLDLRAEEADVPYLFVIGPDQKVDLVFLAYKEAPELLSRYLNIVKGKYFQS